MLVVFEDNEDASISQILKKVYEGTNTRIEFTGGNKNLLTKTVNGDFDNEDMVIIYVDVVPDNETTLGVFKKLVKYTNNRENLHVIPILCIEYYFALAYRSSVTEECSKILDTYGLSYRETELCVRRLKNYIKKKSITIEKYFKAIVNCRMKMCMSNERWVRKEINNQRNLFYKEDCHCSMSEKECLKMCKCEKGCRVVIKLPAFIKGNTIKYFKTNSTNMLKAVQCAVNTYNEFAEAIYLSGYTVRRSILECCWDDTKLKEIIKVK